MRNWFLIGPEFAVLFIRLIKSFSSCSVCERMADLGRKDAESEMSARWAKAPPELVERVFERADLFKTCGLEMLTREGYGKCGTGWMEVWHIPGIGWSHEQTTIQSESKIGKREVRMGRARAKTEGGCEVAGECPIGCGQGQAKAKSNGLYEGSLTIAIFLGQPILRQRTRSRRQSVPWKAHHRNCWCQPPAT